MLKEHQQHAMTKERMNLIPLCAAWLHSPHTSTSAITLLRRCPTLRGRGRQRDTDPGAPACFVFPLPPILSSRTPRMPLAHCTHFSPCLSPLALTTLPWPLPAACATLPCRCHCTYHVPVHLTATCITSPWLRHRTRHIAVHLTVTCATLPSPSPLPTPPTSPQP